jgi:hypothetical protein
MCNRLAGPANNTHTPGFSDQAVRQGSQLAALADIDPAELRDYLRTEIDMHARARALRHRSANRRLDRIASSAV